MVKNFAPTPAFDTLKFVEELTSKDVDPKHAQAIADSLNKILLDILETATDRYVIEQRLKKLEEKWWEKPIFIAIISSVVGAIVSALAINVL